LRPEPNNWPGSAEVDLVSKASATAISEFGIAVKSKLTNAAISGAPEDQLRGPLENLVARLSEIEKWV